MRIPAQNNDCPLIPDAVLSLSEGGNSESARSPDQHQLRIESGSLSVLVPRPTPGFELALLLSPQRITDALEVVFHVTVDCEGNDNPCCLADCALEPHLSGVCASGKRQGVVQH